MAKLLTLASSRDLIEDCMEEQRSAKQDLREIRAEQHRRQREEAAHRYTQVSQVYTDVTGISRILRCHTYTGVIYTM